MLEVAGRRLRNPFPQIAQPLEHLLSQKTYIHTTAAHGDLHTGNILVAGATPVFIDYGLSESEAPIGIDVSRLLGGVIRDVLAHELSLNELAEVLHSALADDAEPESGTGKVPRAHRLLSWMWQEARKVLGEDRDLLWYHLYGYAWIGLKWPDEHGRAHRACYLLAALAATRLLGDPEDSRESVQLTELPTVPSSEQDAALKAVLRILLRTQRMPREAIIQEVELSGEERRKLEALLADGGVFFRQVREGSEGYELRRERDAFDAIARLFLPEPGPDSLVFIQSHYAQSVLSNAFLTERLSSYIRDPAYLKRAQRILRASPGALLRLLASSPPLTKLGFTEVGGTALSELQAEMQRDFRRHPALLLEPGLLEEVLGDIPHLEAEYENLHIQQIVQYHRVFDTDRVIGQWAVPDEIERRAHPEVEGGTTEISLTFRSRDGTHLPNPLEQVAAGQRLGLSLSMQSTEIVEILGEIHGESGNNKKQDWRLEFGQSHRQRSRFFLPAKLDISDAQRCRILFPWDKLLGLEHWTGGLRLKSTYDPGHREADKITLDFRVQVNDLLLDCQEALLLIEAARLGPLRCSLLGSDGLELISGQALDFSEIWGIQVSESDEVQLRQLARLQGLLGVAIPFPWMPLPAEVGTLLLSRSPNGLDEAAALWQEVQQLALEQGRPPLTPIYIEVRDGRRLRDCVATEYRFGRHWPVPTLNGVEGGISQRKLEELLGDPRTEMQMSFFIRLSPYAAVRWLEEHAEPAISGEAGMRPWDLQQFKPRGPEEIHTRVTFCWQKQEDSPWYEVTPFVVRLEALPRWERWYSESSNLYSMGDLKRAWIAAREARELAPDNPKVCGHLGWLAFELDRIDEAIQATEQALKVVEAQPPTASGEAQKGADADSRGEDRYIHHSNLALYHLRAAALPLQDEREFHEARPHGERRRKRPQDTGKLSSPQELEEHLKAAGEHLQKAFAASLELDSAQRESNYRMTRDDFERFRERLAGPMDALIRMLDKLQSGKIQVTEVRESIRSLMDTPSSGAGD